MCEHGRPTKRASRWPRRRVVAIAAALILMTGCMALWLLVPRGTLVEVVNETGVPLDRVLIGGKFGVLAELGRIEPGATAAARVPHLDTRELVVTHQQPGQPQVLDLRFGWLFGDDIYMQRHIRVGIRGSAAKNYVQRRRIYAEPLN